MNVKFVKFVLDEVKLLFEYNSAFLDHVNVRN